MAKVNYQTKGREFRAVSFIDGDHFRETAERIASAGIDLDVYADSERSMFREVRSMAIINSSTSSKSWRDGVRILCQQVVTMDHLIRNGAGFQAVGFGLTVPDPDYRPPEYDGKDGTRFFPSYRLGAYDGYIFFDEQQLLERRYPIPQGSLADMAVTLQYREAI